jgi:serine/threonine protein kinase
VQIGSIVAGKYRIERVIGAGGMGTVVAATHLQLGTELALKFLNDQIKSSANSLERFTREARACAQLRSEHVCKVSDFGMAEGMPYLAMELLDGCDLSKLREAGPLDVSTAAHYVLQACAGLAEAHTMGIVHRDLKPHNLFLSRRADGSPLIKVLDFGIAKIPVGDDISITQTSSILGSPGYMAPEQLRSTKTVDTRADIWALGVILYELAGGRHPFHAETVTEIAVKIAMDDPPPLVEAPTLQPIVSRCLEKDSEHRYPDVAALADALAPLCGRPDLAATVHALLGGSAGTSESRRRSAAALSSRPPADSTAGATPKSRRSGAQLGTDATVAQLGTDATIAQPGIGTDATVASGDVAAVPPPEPVKKKSKLLWAMLALALVGGGTMIAVLALNRPSASPPAPSPGSVTQKTEPAPVPVRKPPPPQPGSAAPAGVASGSAPAPVALVSLEIVVKGAYDPIVSVDGVVWGEGRKIARDLPLGKHHVEIKVSGRPTITKDIELDKARTLTIEVPAAKHVATAPAAGSGSGQPKPPDPPDPAQDAAKQKAEHTARLLQSLRSATIPQLIAGTCLQLAAVDLSVVPWEKCVAAQCSASPQFVMHLVSRAPFAQQQGLRALCPAAAP